MYKKIKRNICVYLSIVALLQNMQLNSFAGVLSPDTRYETFEGEYVEIDDILEKDTADVEVEGKTIANMSYGSFNTHGNASSVTTVMNEDMINVKTTSAESVVAVKNAVLKDNTTYTIVFDLNTNLKYVRYSFRNQNDFAQGITTEDYTDYSINYKRVVKAIRTTTGCTQFVVGIHTPDDAGKYLNVKNMMILEGDWTNKEIPEYFKGVKSVGELENNSLKIKSSNKNLFDTSNLYSQDYGGNKNNATFQVSGDSILVSKKTVGGNFVGLKIRCKKGQTYTAGFIGGSSSSGEVHSMYMYSDKLWGSEFFKIVNDSNSNMVYKTFTPPTNEMYVGIYLGGTVPVGEVLEYKNVFVYEGTNSEYERYQEDFANIALNQPLRSLPSGTSDKIVKKDGKWYVERQVKQITLDGSSDENWSIRSSHFPSNTTQLFCLYLDDDQNVVRGQNIYCERFIPRGGTETDQRDYEAIFLAPNGDGIGLYIRISNSKLNTYDNNGMKQWLASNPINVVYQMITPVYEPLSVPSAISLWLEKLYISNESSIPARMKITVDRVANRAKEYSEKAKINPTIETISQARHWINLMKDSILKDNFQDTTNNIVQVDGLTIDKTESSVNSDIYITMKNKLSISLDTNSITFEEYSLAEDIEKLNALNISVESSLPYSLNAYMPTGIYNSDMSKNLPINTLNIKESSDSTYKHFLNTRDKLVLKDNCSEGKNKIHSIDLKLSASNSQKVDVYKAVLKFEVEQK